MTFNPKALLVLVGVGALLLMATSGHPSGWLHFAEAISAIVILLGVAGFLRESGTPTRRPLR
jgi:threonine/homoserine/homoserine lactone efflux protein